MDGSQFLKSRSRDPFPTTFELILHLFPLVPQELNMHPKFLVSISNRSRDIEGSHNIKGRSRDNFTALFDLFFHFYRVINLHIKFEVFSLYR